MQQTPQIYQTVGYGAGALVLTGVITGLMGLALGLWLGDDTRDQIAATLDVPENMAPMQTNDQTNANTNTPAVQNANEPAFSIIMADLPTSQQTALRTMGFADDEIVITRGTVACVEGEVGSNRMQEIQNGATPSMTESMALVACYTRNQ